LSINTADKIFILVGIVDVVAIFVWLGIALYVAYNKMDMMLGHLKNCSAVTMRTPFKNGGPGGRLFLLGAIIGLMTMPHIYLRHGVANAEDLQNFPPDLKRKLIILQTVGWALMLVMIGMAVVLKLGLV
jgi:hypothetical protein